MEPIRQGICYLSNDGCYLTVERIGGEPVCRVISRPASGMQQDVVNRLFFSVAQTYGLRSKAVLFSGKGIDGVEGMCYIKDAGGTTIVQSPASCINNQLNQIAINTGCIDRVISDTVIAEGVRSLRSRNEFIHTA